MSLNSEFHAREYLRIIGAPLAGTKEDVVSVAWLAKEETFYSLFTSMIERSTDFSWLHKGDRVLVKLALNSGNPNPATSDSWALDCLLRILAKRRAKIYVSDQSGVRNVFWTAAGQQRGSSRAFCKATGMMDIIEANGANPVFFEEMGYDSYVETYPTGAHHWKTPLQITSFVKEVDHIIYLPRLGSHGFADITSGMKIGVGFLREDSRRALHQGGENFYAMYEEINEVPEIKNKLRLIVTAGRKVMSLIGPDAGYILEPQGAPIFASENLMAHEIFAYAFLQYCREYMTPKDASDEAIGGNLWEVQKNRTVRNRGFLNYVWSLPENQVPAIPVWQPGNICEHPAIINYMRHNQQKNIKFSVAEINQNPDPFAAQYLQLQLRS